MKNRWHFTLWVGGEIKETHVVECPSGKGWYTSMISMQYFCDRENKRIYDAMEKYRGQDDVWGKIYKAVPKRMSMDSAAQVAMTLKHCPDYYSVPNFYHKSIWDMYKAVGYDYKKKRYV